MSQPQLNVVLIRIALVMVSLHSSKTLTKTFTKSLLLPVALGSQNNVLPQEVLESSILYNQNNDYLMKTSIAH